ncbi:MAG: hypothetical protein JJE35_02525 [Thermoleophilia bacterium]|nr:hypothetical protein [Thermoleophilia bacterium]
MAPIVFVALLATVCFTFLLAAAPKASATLFCQNVQLNPYGQGGDRCWGPALKSLNWGQVLTVNRAGCVDIADTSNNLLSSWNCAAAGAEATIFVSNDLTTYRKVVIRNNNVSNAGTFTGGQQCVLSC